MIIAYPSLSRMRAGFLASTCQLPSVHDASNARSCLLDVRELQAILAIAHAIPGVIVPRLQYVNCHVTQQSSGTADPRSLLSSQPCWVFGQLMRH